MCCIIQFAAANNILLFYTILYSLRNLNMDDLKDSIFASELDDNVADSESDYETIEATINVISLPDWAMLEGTLFIYRKK